MLTLLVAELMATGLIGSRLLGVDYGIATIVGACAIFACFVVRGSGCGGLDGLLFPVLIVALLVPLAMLSASGHGLPVPQIWHLFGFKPEMTRHLAAFTQEVMRGPSPLPAGWRELIAAFTSRRNDCLF